jgi:hypothetical protein
MEKTYVIAWKSFSRGTSGRGKTLFSHEEADQVAAELNQEHPDFLHEPMHIGGQSDLTLEPQFAQLNLSEILFVPSDQEEVFA